MNAASVEDDRHPRMVKLIGERIGGLVDGRCCRELGDSFVQTSKFRQKPSSPKKLLKCQVQITGNEKFERE
jgi:hypothetical protein